MSENYRPQQEEPEIISTSQAVNLTSTIASLSALFALFFCFADQRSRAVRRFSVQSVGLGAIHLLLGMVIWILCEVLGWIPLIGGVLRGLLLLVLTLATILVIVLRVRMALHAYRGEAHVLPVIGQALRRFE
ncbi:MAG: hypothetical protein PUK79_00480 [Clostridiales bacterium]|nr:hypothetical protein [Clostridiales bacterium]MDY2833974.1 hypothetical protein [Candidatus Aphodomonas sp.]